MAYGGSQARGRIGAIAPGLHHSHSKAESELRLQPQLRATPDPLATEWGQGSNLHLMVPTRICSAAPQWELPYWFFV